MSQPLIQWYPGHIAKAEKALTMQLKRVDVVIEVRDARIPIASAHPKMSTWIEGRVHLLVLNRLDLISITYQKHLLKWFNNQGYEVFFTNSKDGEGIKPLLKAAQLAGVSVNERRKGRGMLPRPVNFQGTSRCTGVHYRIERPAIYSRGWQRFPPCRLQTKLLGQAGSCSYQAFLCARWGACKQCTTKARCQRTWTTS
jgi:hypothetical protein